MRICDSAFTHPFAVVLSPEGRMACTRQSPGTTSTGKTEARPGLFITAAGPVPESVTSARCREDNANTDAE